MINISNSKIRALIIKKGFPFRLYEEAYGWGSLKNHSDYLLSDMVETAQEHFEENPDDEMDNSYNELLLFLRAAEQEEGFDKRFYHVLKEIVVDNLLS